MTTLEKIKKLNDVCDNTLCMTSSLVWKINSYGENTPLNMENKYPYFEDVHFHKVIDKAYKFVFRNK